MKIYLGLILLLSILFSCTGKSTSPTKNEAELPKNSIENQTDNQNTAQKMNSEAKSIHSFVIESLEGSKIDFKKFAGKKILIVNTASECGYTPQYADLQKLYEKYQDKLVVVGIPANNFGGQEPGTAQEIKSFCQKNYGVTFPMAAKLSAAGADRAPIFNWLCQKEENGVMNGTIKWNFTKFLIDENGKIIANFASGVNPLSEEITKLL